MVKLSNERRNYDYVDEAPEMNTRGSFTYRDGKIISDLWGNMTLNEEQIAGFNYSENIDGTFTRTVNNVTVENYTAVDAKITEIITDIKNQLKQA